jgi:uncharacterized YigZ family protein
VLYFNTFAKEFSAEFKKRSSRFICFGMPITSVEEAVVKVGKIKAKFFDAKHHVYVYILHSGERKICGDGEPYGSAAEPVFDYLSKNNFSDVLVVITRYFGGTLLGIGGMVRAYSKGVRLVAEGCGTAVKIFCVFLKIEFPYDFYRLFSKIAEEFTGKAIDLKYDERIKVNFCCPKERFTAFENKITDVSGGIIKFDILKEDYFVFK